MNIPLIKATAIVAGAALAGGGYLAVTHPGSVGGVSIAGPVCVTRTVQPGGTVTAAATIVNSSGATAKLDLSTDPVIGQPVGPPYPDGGHPIPKSWVDVSGPYNLAPRTTARAPVTIHIPAGAPRGRYGTMIGVYTYAGPSSGPGSRAAFGGGTQDYLEVPVGVRPERGCDGLFTPYDPPFPVCGHKQSPGRLGLCRVLPLTPPVADARNCHKTRAWWAQYEHQLSLTGSQQDAWCVVDGRILNSAAYYLRTRMYRQADNGQGGPVTGGRWSGARPVNNPDNWRTAGTR